VILKVALPVVHEAADAGTQRLDAAAAERYTLGDKLAVVDMPAVAINQSINQSTNPSVLIFKVAKPPK